MLGHSARSNEQILRRLIGFISWNGTSAWWFGANIRLRPFDCEVIIHQPVFVLLNQPFEFNFDSCRVGVLFQYIILQLCILSERIELFF